MAHLNSAEGIQNMCATQIMTKSLWERVSQARWRIRPGAHLLFPKCITNFNLFPSQSHEKTGGKSRSTPGRMTPIPSHSRVVFLGVFLPITVNYSKNIVQICHDQAPLSDSLLPLTATCGGLFTSCHRLPHVGEQSVLIHSTVCSISLAPVTHFPSPIYSGLCPLSVSVCHLWFVLPVVENLLSRICILCPGSPGEE